MTAFSGDMIVDSVAAESVPPRGSGWVRSLPLRKDLGFAPTRYREVVLTVLSASQ